MEFSTYLQSLFAERETALMAEMQQRAADADRNLAEANRRAAHAQEQGQRYGIIEGLIAILELRFDATAVQALRPVFENIKEVERLKQLLPAAGQAPNLEAFLQQLAE